MKMRLRSIAGAVSVCAVFGASSALMPTASSARPLRSTLDQEASIDHTAKRTYLPHRDRAPRVFKEALICLMDECPGPDQEPLMCLVERRTALAGERLCVRRPLRVELLNRQEDVAPPWLNGRRVDRVPDVLTAGKATYSDT